MKGTSGHMSDTPPLTCKATHGLSLQLRGSDQLDLFPSVLSLFGFAITINSAILIVAAASFYYGIGGGDPTKVVVGDLFDAYNLIKQYVSKGSSDRVPLPTSES